MRISDWSSDVCSSDLVDDALDDGGCFGKRYDAGNPGEFPRISHGDGVAVLGKVKDNDADDHRTIDRKSVVLGESVSVRVDLGGRRIIKKKKNYTQLLCNTTNIAIRPI